MFDVANVRSSFAVVHSADPFRHALHRRGKGHFVVMSSLAAKLPSPGRSVYLASKCAINGYFNSLCFEVLQREVKVMFICPSPIEVSRSQMGLGLSERMFLDENVSLDIHFAHVCVYPTDVVLLVGRFTILGCSKNHVCVDVV